MLCEADNLITVLSNHIRDLSAKSYNKTNVIALNKRTSSKKSMISPNYEVIKFLVYRISRGPELRLTCTVLWISVKN